MRGGIGCDMSRAWAEIDPNRISSCAKGCLESAATAYKRVQYKCAWLRVMLDKRLNRKIRLFGPVRMDVIQVTCLLTRCETGSVFGVSGEASVRFCSTNSRNDGFG